MPSRTPRTTRRKTHPTPNTQSAATSPATSASPSASSPAGRARVPAHLSSQSHEWPTPADFFAALHAEFGFVLDVCATTANHKADAYFALEHPDRARRNGLAGDWAGEAAELGGAVWMNPPYGRPIAAWMAKAFAAARAGVVVVTLVPVRADTAWWHEYVLATGAEVRYVRGRLTFGGAVNTAAFASAVVIYRPTDVVGAPGPVTTMPAHPRPPAAACHAAAATCAVSDVLTPMTSSERRGTSTNGAASVPGGSVAAAIGRVAGGASTQAGEYRGRRQSNADHRRLRPATCTGLGCPARAAYAERSARSSGMPTESPRRLESVSPGAARQPLAQEWLGWGVLSSPTHLGEQRDHRMGSRQGYT